MPEAAAVSQAPATQPVQKPKDKKSTFDFIDLIFFVPIALLWDLASVIPGIGDIGLIAFRFAFWIKKVDTKLMNMLMGAGGVVEVIPAISALPAVTAFVVIVFIEVKVMEKVKKASPKAAAALEKAEGAATKGTPATAAVAAGAEAAAGKSGSGSNAAAGGSAQTSGSESVSGQQAEGRTLQDGSQSASGSPIAGGEGGTGVPTEEPTTAKSSGQQTGTQQGGAQGDGAQAPGQAQQPDGSQPEEPVAEANKEPEIGQPQEADSGPSAEDGRFAGGKPVAVPEGEEGEAKAGKVINTFMARRQAQERAKQEKEAKRKKDLEEAA